MMGGIKCNFIWISAPSASEKTCPPFLCSQKGKKKSVLFSYKWFQQAAKIALLTAQSSLITCVSVRARVRVWVGVVPNVLNLEVAENTTHPHVKCTNVCMLNQPDTNDFHMLTFLINTNETPTHTLRQSSCPHSTSRSFQDLWFESGRQSAFS